MSSGATTPSPNSMKSQSTVLYDGDCRFCIARVAEIKAWDTSNSMEYIPRQDTSCDERFPALTGLPLDDGIVFIATDGHMSVAADAMYEIARLLPPTRGFAWLYQVPILKQLAQIGYRIIAANRKRLGKTCEGDICSLDDPKDK